MSILTDLRFAEGESPQMSNFNKRFKTLNRLNTCIGDEWVWERRRHNATLGDSESVNLHSNKDYSNGSATLRYSDNIEITFEGKVRLKNPEEITVSYNNFSAVNVFAGKYFAQKDYHGNEIGIYLGAPDGIATQTRDGNSSWFYTYFPGKLVSSLLEEDNYVNSPDPTAYPPAEPDGYTYTPLGQLGDKVRIATGSYTGTGTYGSANPNTLTFDFEPKYILITQRDSSGQYTVLLIIAIRLTASYSNYVAIEDYGRIGSYVYAKKDNFTVSWYANGASSQSNGANKVYDYLALG